MTDGQTLFAIFALLYLVECLRLQPPTLWVAAGWRKSGWKTLRPWARLKVGQSSPLLLSVLPPLPAYTFAHLWLFIPEDAGLRVLIGESQTVLVPWEQVTPRAEESTLHVDSHTRLSLLNATLAKVWEKRLGEWRDDAPEGRRASFLKYAADSLDTAKAEETARTSADHTRTLRFHGELLFLWCFGVISAVYHRFGDGPLVLYSAGALILLQFVQAWFFLRATASLKTQMPHRVLRAVGIALLPQASMRAADGVCLAMAETEEPPHPVAWRRLLDEQQWRTMARQFWREARYVPGWMTQTDHLPVTAQALLTFFEQEQIATEVYDPLPSSTLPTCPRCGAEFQAGVARCQDCGGVELRQPTR